MVFSHFILSSKVILAVISISIRGSYLETSAWKKYSFYNTFGFPFAQSKFYSSSSQSTARTHPIILLKQHPPIDPYDFPSLFYLLLANLIFFQHSVIGQFLTCLNRLRLLFSFSIIVLYIFSLVSAFSQKNKTYKMGLRVCVSLCVCLCVCVCVCV